MNNSQRQQIDNFVSMTCTSKQIAEKYLVKTKWNFQNAINEFYDDGAPMPEPEKITTVNQIETFFKENSVVENDSRILNEDALEKLFEILKINSQNTVIGHIMINVMEMKKAGQATKENLYNLLHYTKTRSLKQFSAHIPELEKQLKSRKDLHKKMFLGFFEFYSVTKVATLDYDIAVQIWDTYLKGIMTHHAEFIKYLEQKNPKPFKIHKDTWKLVYQFAMSFERVEDVKEEDGWPLLIDQFLVYLKSKNLK